MNRYIIGLSFIAGLLTFLSCTKSTILGTEILEGDFVNVAYSDTSGLHFKTIQSDSTRVFPLISNVFMMGQINDPVFGDFESYAYFEIKKSFDITSHSGSILDSVVLSVSYTKDHYWGNTDASFDIQVYELGESLATYDTLYSNQEIEKGAMLGTTTFNPFTGDTLKVATNTDTVTYYNICRVKLDNSFGEKLFNDSTVLNNETLLAGVTNGIWLRARTQDNGVFSIYNSLYLDAFSNKLIFYYKDAAGVSKTHYLTLGGKRGVHYKNQFNGSEANKFLNGTMDSDSLSFLSGGQGLSIQVDIPYPETYADVLINYAYLDFYAADLLDIPGMLPYTKVDRVNATYKQPGKSSKYIADLNYSVVGSAPAYFGGFLQEVLQENGTKLYKYRLNVTNEIKRRIKENDRSPIILTPFLSESRAYRSAIFGPGHSKYPARLRVTYTTI